MCELSDEHAELSDVLKAKCPPIASDRSDCISIARGMEGVGWTDGWRNGWKGKKMGVEQNGSRPTHGRVGKHEVFGELERQRSPSGQR